LNPVIVNPVIVNRKKETKGTLDSFFNSKQGKKGFVKRESSEAEASLFEDGGDLSE